jgi:hypothetical protein
MPPFSQTAEFWTGFSKLDLVIECFEKGGSEHQQSYLGVLVMVLLGHLLELFQFCVFSVPFYPHFLGGVFGGAVPDSPRGWHCFRHSFVSNCSARGVDQRLIDQVGRTHH